MFEPISCVGTRQGWYTEYGLLPNRAGSYRARTLKVSSSAVVKTIKRYDETGSHEDCDRTGRTRLTSSLELTAP